MFRSLGPKPSAIATDEGFTITYEETKHGGRPNKAPERQQRVKAKSIKYVRPCSPERSSQVSGHNKHPLYSEDGSGGGGQHPPPNKDFAQQINALLNNLNQGNEEDEGRHDHRKLETFGAHIKALQKKRSTVIADDTNVDDSSNNKKKQKYPAAQAQAQITTGFGWPSSPPPPDTYIYNNDDADEDEGDHWRSQVGFKIKMLNTNSNNTGLTPRPLTTAPPPPPPPSFAGGGGISVDIDLLQIHMHKQAHAGPTTAGTKPSQRPTTTTTTNNNNYNYNNDNKATTRKRLTPKSFAAHSLLLASSKKKSPRTTVYTIRDETTGQISRDENSGAGRRLTGRGKKMKKKSNKMKKGTSSFPAGLSSEDEEEEEVIEDDSESEEEEEHVVAAIDQHERRDGRQTGTTGHYQHSHQSVLHAPVTLPFTLEHQAAYKTPANATPIFSNNGGDIGGGTTTRLAALLGASKQTQQQQGASPFPPPPNNSQHQQLSAAVEAGPSTYPGAQQQHPSLHDNCIRHLLATAPSQQQQPHAAPSSPSPLSLQQHHHHPIGNNTTRRRGTLAAGLYARARAQVRVEQQALNQSHRQGNGVRLVCQGPPQYEGDLTKVLCTPLDNNSHDTSSSQEVVGTTVMVVMSGRVARSLECCLDPGVRVTVQRPFKVMQQVPGVQWPVIMAAGVTGTLE